MYSVGLRFRPTSDVSRSSEEAKRIYTREYAKYKDMFACFKSMLSMCSEPESMYLHNVVELQNFILNLHVQSEEVRSRKVDIMIWRTREREDSERAGEK